MLIKQLRRHSGTPRQCYRGHTLRRAIRVIFKVSLKNGFTSMQTFAWKSKSLISPLSAPVKRRTDASDVGLLLGRQKENVQRGFLAASPPHDLAHPKHQRSVVGPSGNNGESDATLTLGRKADPNEIRALNIRPSDEFEEELPLQRILE